MSNCISPSIISSSTMVTSKTSSNAQLRKIKKPLIERRRRERINDCLIQLKSLVLEAMHKDESRYSKMEKADILEMTVLHLKAVQKQISRSSLKSPVTNDEDRNHCLARYMIGFSECAHEVSQYLSKPSRDSNDNVRFKLMNHLGGCLSTNSEQDCDDMEMTDDAFASGLVHKLHSAPTSSDLIPLNVHQSPNSKLTSGCPSKFDNTNRAAASGNPVYYLSSALFEDKVQTVLPPYIGSRPDDNVETIASGSDRKSLGGYQNNSILTQSNSDSDNGIRSSPVYGDIAPPSQIMKMKSQSFSTEFAELSQKLSSHVAPLDLLANVKFGVWRPW